MLNLVLLGLNQSASQVNECRLKTCGGTGDVSMLAATPVPRPGAVQPEVNVDPGSTVNIWQYLFFILTSIYGTMCYSNYKILFQKRFHENYIKHSDTVQHYIRIIRFQLPSKGY